MHQCDNSLVVRATASHGMYEFCFRCTQNVFLLFFLGIVELLQFDVDFLVNSYNAKE